MQGMATRRIASALLILSQVLLPGCDSTGPVHDEYTFTTPLGGGSIKIDRPGGPMIVLIDAIPGWCMWFTNTSDPGACIGECIDLKNGFGGVVPPGADTWHAAPCDKCPCQPEEPGGDPPCDPQGRGAGYLMSKFITDISQPGGYVFAASTNSPWQAQRAYEHLRDQKPRDGFSAVSQYLAVERLGKDFREWRVVVRDDDQKIENVHVYLDGNEIGKTAYSSGDWGFGSETAVELAVRDIRHLIGREVNLRLTWDQGGGPREWTYKALLQ